MKHQRLTAGLAGATAVAILLACSAAWAQQGQPAAAAAKPDALVKSRQSSFQVIAFNSGRIKASVEGQYNKDDVIKAANTIAAVANGLGPLFAPGTDKGKGWHDTAALPDAFNDSYRFAQLGETLGREALELAKVADSGELPAVKAQYAKVTRTCKACHDDYRSKD